MGMHCSASKGQAAYRLCRQRLTWKYRRELLQEAAPLRTVTRQCVTGCQPAVAVGGWKLMAGGCRPGRDSRADPPILRFVCRAFSEAVIESAPPALLARLAPVQRQRPLPMLLECVLGVRCQRAPAIAKTQEDHSQPAILVKESALVEALWQLQFPY